MDPQQKQQEITLSSILDDIVAREGGYVNHPADKGGPTKYGITLATLRRERGEDMTEADVAKLTAKEAKRIYYKTYVAPFVGLADARLLSLIADSSVHHGATRTTKWLQTAAGVTADGRMGPDSVRKLKTVPHGVLYDRLLQQRSQFLEELGKKESQKVFLEGWRKRLGEFDANGSGNNR